MDFGKHPNNCKQICWNPCHVYKSEMREAWKGYFRNGENTLFYVQRHVRLIVILPLNNLHVCWGTKCSNVVASTPLGCIKIHWPQKSAIKMLQINATTKNCLELQQKSQSTRFHHTGGLKTPMDSISFFNLAEIGWYKSSEKKNSPILSFFPYVSPGNHQLFPSEGRM